MLTVDPAVLQARLGQVEDLLAQEELAALVVYAQGSALGWASRMHGYISFLSDWDSHHYPSVFIVIPGADPVLLTPNKFLHYLAGADAPDRRAPRPRPWRGGDRRYGAGHRNRQRNSDPLSTPALDLVSGATTEDRP